VLYYPVVEGHGESDAILNLLHRLQRDLALPSVVWERPLRQRASTCSQVQRVAEIVRGRGDADGLLITRDDEDGCPRDSGPLIAEWLKELALPFPAAVVLFYREYETLFLPCVKTMAGQPLVDGAVRRPGLRADASCSDDYEARRDAKGVLTDLMPPGRAYKPTTDQLAFTRMLDFQLLRQSGLPCFGTLERALRFLLEGHAKPGSVFPVDR
jgi:hypothetical protein